MTDNPKFADHARSFNAHGGIGSLSAEIDTLRAENERLREQVLNREAEVEGLESARAGDDMAIDMLKAEIERLRAALEKHHDLLSDEPGDNCNTCGTAWDGALASDKRA